MARLSRRRTGPDFLLNGETLGLPADLDGLAVRALDRILADESEWRSLWEESEHYAEAQAELMAIRLVLCQLNQHRRNPR